LNRLLAQRLLAASRGVPAAAPATGMEAKGEGTPVPGGDSGAGRERMGGTEVLDINRIREILPHRYPFLLVDRVIEMDPKKRVVAVKNVTMNEGFFQGHFPGEPIMPGVLIVEAMAQTAAILFLGGLDSKGTIVFLAGLDGVKFRRRVVPGDQIVLDATIERVRLPFGIARTSAKVDGELVAEATIKFAMDRREGGAPGKPAETGGSAP
jgi:3-hydroxyacyl-[acyl-carrier-protein] dehydratase